jgi:hypothetical protein
MALIGKPDIIQFAWKKEVEKKTCELLCNKPFIYIVAMTLFCESPL